MTGRVRSWAGVAAAAAALVVGQLAPTGPSSAAPPGSAEAAAGHLSADATASITTVARRGELRFAGARDGGRIDHPGVDARTPLAEAARAHLARYGAAFGVTRPGTTLEATGTTRTGAGQDVVRFRQEVGGVPVVGGEVVLSLRADRDLASVLATLSRETGVRPPSASEEDAADTALAVAARRADRPASALTVRREGRWLLDPAVIGGDPSLGARTAYRFEVGDGVGVRRMVLVDDRTGGVLANLDQVQHADRVVCDSANLPAAQASPCTSGFARTEGGTPSAVADVEDAFELSGVTSDFYAEIGGIDLTDELGVTVGGVKKLASTVRFCYVGRSCPYGNAFWNGTQMYYGQDFAGADDVVGHEMTHGIIDRRSELFYWGQSGAINESIADIMGEIVDHRNVGPGDSHADWALAEDLPIGAIRHLADPTLHGHPDKMTSPLYFPDLDYQDSGGVHYNSGVGNKTAYLISQGGTFNGRTVTGIDGADADLTRTATLYLDVLERLSSGSGYADLAVVLDQSCADLVGTAGITAAHCTQVHEAGLATELTTTPPGAPQPPDAPDTCPDGLVKRVLLDAEAAPATSFVPGSTWGYGERSAWGANASSGQDSWYSTSPGTLTTSSLVAGSGVALPDDQPSYLWFQQWRLLDFEGTTYYDGGTVEVDDLGTPEGPQDAAGLAWVNGPQQPLQAPNSGRLAFSGDSFGYTASRLDLSSFAGSTVKPQFTMRTDLSVEYIGWWLDDIEVYTCDPPAVENTSLPTVSGTAKVPSTLTATPGTWAGPDVTTSYQWLRNGAPVAGRTGTTYRLGAADVGRRIAVRVTATAPGSSPGTATSAATAPVLAGTLTAGKPRMTGTPKVGKKLKAAPGTWGPSGVALAYQWLRGKKPIAGATGTTYKATAKDAGKKVAVRVTGSKSGYTSTSATSSAKKVKPRKK